MTHIEQRDGGHGHQHGRGHEDEHGDGIEDIQFTREFWDDRYGSAERLWSGNPNHQLVAQLTGLTPGEALDAGCGEGADAIWLAGLGWQVTAVDVSPVALGRGAAAAARRGAEIAARITWQPADLLSWVPPAERFDLVSAQFMHLPRPAYADLIARLATGVRAGGTLLVVGHHPDDLHHNLGRKEQLESHFVAAEDLAATLGAQGWEIGFAGAVTRPQTDLDGQVVSATDSVLRAIRP